MRGTEREINGALKSGHPLKCRRVEEAVDCWQRTLTVIGMIGSKSNKQGCEMNALKRC